MCQDLPLPDSAGVRSRRLRKWRAIQGFGGLSLAASMFLPAIKTCNQTLVPVVKVYKTLSGPNLSLGEVISTFCVFVTPYLFGWLTFIVALRGWRHVNKTEGGAERSITVLFTVIAAFYLGSILWEIRVNGWSNEMPVHTTIGLFSLGYWVLTVRRGVGGRLCLRWWASVCCALWFTFICSDGSARYGVFVSWLGSVMIACALFAEARVRCRLGRFATLGRMLTARLQVYPTDEPRCPTCGYLLIGLPSDRCPECGTRYGQASQV